jgi:hypothetical protein
LLKLVFHIALLGILILPAGEARALESGSGTWMFNIEGGFAAQQESDIESGPGSFSVDREFISAGASYAWDRRKAIGVSVGGGQSDYNFMNFPADLPEEYAGIAGDGPWGKIEDVRISISTRFALGKTGTGFLIPSARSNAESGASSADGRTYGLFGGAAWRINKDLNLGPGFGIFSRLESGVRFFPILVIDWNLGERWNLSTGRGLAASQGPGLTLTWQATESFDLGLAGRYERQEFRLSDDGPVPGGVGRDQSFPLVLTASWNPNQTIGLSLFAGMEFGGELRLEDEIGEFVSKQSYDPAPILGAIFRLNF